MLKRIIILLLMAGVSFGYFEISDDVPSIFSDSGDQQWRLWAGNLKAESLYNDSSGIIFDEVLQSVVVGKFTPGDYREWVSALGYDAANPTFAPFISAVGGQAGSFNAGDDLTAMGWSAGLQNTGASVSAFGLNAALYNGGDNNTAIGWAAFSTWVPDVARAGTVTNVDFANNQITIGAGHGWGAIETYLNLKATTTGVLPDGLSPNAELWIVISSTVVECLTDSFTDAGTGTHTLTPKTEYTNSTALGYNAQPDDDNQVMLGDTNVTEVKTTGSISAAGLTLSTTRVTSSPYTILASDYNIYVDTDGGDITVNLPVGADGKTYRIVNVGSSDNDVTLVPNGAELLNGVNANESIFDGEKFILSYETTEGWW